jgi:hypothetical protein
MFSIVDIAISFESKIKSVDSKSQWKNPSLSSEIVPEYLLFFEGLETQQIISLPLD